MNIEGKGKRKEEKNDMRKTPRTKKNNKKKNIMKKSNRVKIKGK